MTPTADPTRKTPPAPPAAPAPGSPVYPRLKYRAIPEAPGFAYTKVNSADEEAALADPNNPANKPDEKRGAALAETRPGTQPPLTPGPAPEAPPDGRLKTPQPGDQPATAAGAFQWFDTPAEAQLARAQGHRPYEEYGREIDAPVGIPAPLRPQFISQMQVAAADASATAAAAGPEAETEYPALRYQAIEEAPGFKYVKVNSAEEEKSITAAGGDPWYKTPAEAIKNKPAAKKQEAQGQRPSQTGTGSAPGPAAPEGQGGAAVPQPHHDPQGEGGKAQGTGGKPDEPEDTKKPKNGGNGGKHR